MMSREYLLPLPLLLAQDLVRKRQMIKDTLVCARGLIHSSKAQALLPSQNTCKGQPSAFSFPVSLKNVFLLLLFGKLLFFFG